MLRQVIVYIYQWEHYQLPLALIPYICPRILLTAKILVRFVVLS